MVNQTSTLQNKPNKSVIIIGILAAFLLPLGLTIAVGSLNINYYDKLFYSRFIPWLTVLLLFLYARKVERQDFLLWAESKPALGFFLVSVVVLYLLSIAAAIVSSIPTLFGWHENNEVMKKIVKLLKGRQVFIFYIALTAGITEEFIFRGYMLTRLSQLFKNPYIPVIISSLLFGALHYKYNSLREVIFAFLIGIIFSIYYLKYRNIKALMAAHFFIDFINLTLAQHLKMK